MLRQREVAKSLAVDQALALGDLQTQRAQYLAVRTLGHLEFRHPLRQVVNPEVHGLPDGRQVDQVIQGSTPHAVFRRTHAPELRIPEREFKVQKLRATQESKF